MSPPADDLIGLAFSLSPLVVIRLPRAVGIHEPEELPIKCVCRDIEGGGSWRWLALRVD